MQVPDTESSQNLKSWFLPYQIRWLKDESAVKIWEKSRRIGATYVQSYEDVRDVVSGKVDKVWFSSADESAAKEYIMEASKWALMFDKAARSLGEELLDEKNDIKALVIEFSNGGRIHALSSNPKAFRSKGGKVVLDEFAFHEQDEKLWKAAKPSATWGYPIRILSTHNGKQCLYYRFLERIAQGKLNWSVHKTPITQAIEEGLYDKIKKGKTTQEEREAWLEELRQDSFDQDTFNEEFMCVPVEGRTRFLPYDLIATCEDDGILYSDEELQNCRGNLYIGFDIARKKDLSVIVIAEKIASLLIVRRIHVMEKTPFHIQRDVLFNYLRLPSLRRACIDATGLGMQLGEEAQYSFGKYKVEAITFTGNVKQELAFPLRSAFEEKNIRIPYDPKLRDDLASVKKIVTASGAIRFMADHTDDGHADRFYAVGLANHAADDYQGPVWVKSAHSKPQSTVINNGY